MIDTLETRQHLAADVNLAIDFQPASAPKVTGWLVDSGQTYRSQNGLTYGWTFNQTGSTRDRNASADQVKDTLVLTGASKWEVALPNGRYTVAVNAGDPTWFDSRYDFKVENTTVVKGVGTRANPYLSGTQTVEVKDGRLTLSNGPTAYLNKVSSLTIKSATTTGSSNDGKPAVPTGLTHAGVSTKAINLRWTDASPNEQGFYVQQSADGSNWFWVATAGEGEDAITVSGLEADEQYYFRVMSFNGSGQSSASNVLSVRTPAGASAPSTPAGPNGLAASSVNAYGAGLTWSDNANNESGFHLERGTNGSTFSRVASLSANAESFTSGDLAPNATYYFRVAAYNAAGTSGYSNVLTVRTPAASNNGGGNGNGGGNSGGNSGGGDDDVIPISSANSLAGVSANISGDSIDKWAVPAKSLGVKRIRTWYNIADKDWKTHGAVGQWMIDKLAKWKSYGFEVMLTVQSDHAAPTAADASRVFGILANSALRNIVDYWQIGNEVNWSYSFKDSMPNYVNKMLAPAYQQLHAVGEKVVGAGPTYDVNAVKTLVGLGYNNYVDFAAFHPYGETAAMVIDRIKGAKAAFGNKPMIVTEWNINNAGLSQAQRKAGLDQIAAMLPQYTYQSYYFALAKYSDPTIGAAGLLNNAQPASTFHSMFYDWTH